MAHPQKSPVRAEPFGTGRGVDLLVQTRLLQRAREIGINGRSKMTKAELIQALRNG